MWNIKWEVAKNHVQNIPMWSSSEFSVKTLIASGCLSLSFHISRAHAIICNSTGCVITCGFTSFGGLRSTLPNQVKLSCTVQWQSGMLVWDIPRGKHACVSIAITVFGKCWMFHSLVGWLSSAQLLLWSSPCWCGHFSTTRSIVLNVFNSPSVSIITFVAVNLSLNSYKYLTINPPQQPQGTVQESHLVVSYTKFT